MINQKSNIQKSKLKNMKDKKRLTITGAVFNKFNSFKKLYGFNNNRKALEYLIDFYQKNNPIQQKLKRKRFNEKKKSNSKNHQEHIFLNITYNTKYLMIPKLILNYFQFAKVNEKVAEKNKHYTQFSIEKNNNKQIVHTSDYIRNQQIQNEDILLISNLLFSSIGYTDYTVLFSLILGKEKLINKNLFYKIQKEFIFLIINKIWEKHQNKISIDVFYNLIVGGRFSRPPRKKGPSRYVTEVCITVSFTFKAQTFNEI
ncbi:hypothetical protein M0812_15385 [Anaeramoeba flamelloides]|uniref:Ribosomal protein L5 n=1 Tax=Anaeramoeba flamelloides TaxID=1746091 RepID=A0AAV7ZHT5_9EUKA|nr:hypothetical protein M0812_15385 [Anaeramoeba flamelloides]